MREFKQIVSDVDMMQKAKDIREWLCHLSGLIPRLNEDPNPYYGSTMDGLVLIHYYGGPSAVGTPFGQWGCTGGGSLKKIDWFEEAEERLGLVELMPETQISDGCFGPVHAITKDLDGNLLPAPAWELLGIGIPAIRSRSIWGSKTFGNVMDAMMVANTIEVDQDELSRILSEREWDERTTHELGREICRVYWTRIKNQIGFIDWMEEKRQRETA